MIFVTRARSLPASPIRATRAVTGVLATLLWGCGGPVDELGYELLRTLPHDDQAYTQGFLHHEGTFFESTGQYGRSEIRQVDVATGQVLRRQALDEARFGEGLARVGDTLIQLTWKAGEAYVYDIATLTRQGVFAYEGEGWGLCHDGETLFMSNGTATLVKRDPVTFEITGELRVTRNGFSLQEINELECVGGDIFANVYLSDQVVRIDKLTGEVTGEIDAAPGCRC